MNSNELRTSTQELWDHSPSSNPKQVQLSKPCKLQLNYTIRFQRYARSPYYLKTSAKVKGTTTSPWSAKIQRIGLLNITQIQCKKHKNNTLAKRYSYKCSEDISLLLFVAIIKRNKVSKVRSFRLVCSGGTMEHCTISEIISKDIMS